MTVAVTQYARRKPEELLYLAQVGKLKRTPCQAVHVGSLTLPGGSASTPPAPGSKPSTTLPVLWMQHAPGGRQLQPFTARSDAAASSLLAQGAMPVLPVACRLTGHPKADSLGLRWLRYYLRTASSTTDFAELRTPGGFHPSLLQVSAAGVVRVPASAFGGGSADPVSCIVATIQRPTPWWASLPAWMLRRVVNEPALFAHESMFLTGPVCRFAEEEAPQTTPPGSNQRQLQASSSAAPQQEKQHTSRHAAAQRREGGPAPEKGGRLRQAMSSAVSAGSRMTQAISQPLSSAASRVRSLSPPWPLKRGDHDNSSTKPHENQESASTAASGTSADKAALQSTQRKKQQPGLLRRAGGAVSGVATAIWSKVPRFRRQHKKAGSARDTAVYSPPKGFQLPEPPKQKQGVWSRMVSWRFGSAPPAMAKLPPHPEGAQATNLANVDGSVHPRDVLFCMGGVSLGAHLARHGAAVADTTLTLHLSRGNDGTAPHGGLEAVQLQWAAPVHSLAAAVGEAEAAQTAAAVHGVGVWSDETFAESLAEELDSELR